MARLAAVILVLLSAVTAEAQVWRSTYRPYDFSPNPARRIPQYYLASTFANLPSTNVADGDLGYVDDVDREYVRRNGAWEVVAHSGFDGWIKASTIVQLAVSTDTVVVGDTTMVSFSNKMEIQGLLGLRTHSDTGGESPAINSYRSRGTRSSPTHVLANNSIFRWSANAYNQTGSYLTPFTLTLSAIDDQTASARGTKLSISNTKVGDAVASETLIGYGTKWYIGDPATDNYIVTTGLGSGFGRLHVRQGMSTGSPDDNDSNQAVLGLYRYRDGSTPPSAAGFGSRLSYRLEGFTNGSDVEAAGISGNWDIAQANDTTSRDSNIDFWTMLNNSLTQRIRINSLGELYPFGDITQNTGTPTNRWNDMWVNRVLAGEIGTLGEGSLSAAKSDGGAHVAMYSGANNQFIMPFFLTRRARGSLTSPSAVTAGDYQYLQDHYAYFGGAYTLIARSVVVAESATSSVGSQWQWLTQTDSGSPTTPLRFALTKNGNVVAGDQAAALATSATDGFLYGRTTAGQPTGTATAYTGSAPQVYDSTNNSLYTYNSGWKQVGGNIIRVAADVSDTTGGFVNVTGLTFPVKASTTYTFQCNLAHVTAVNTTALQVSINGPSTPTAMRYCVETATTATTPHYACQNAYDTVTNPATGAAGTSLPVTISGTLENGANAGTLAIRMRTEVAASSVTVQRGSFCQVQQF